jgi:predicted acyltransferase
MAKSSSRLVSLDIFRGMTIAFMIIVNTPGSWKYVYAPLRHAEWHGCTPTDLVFPFFLFIVGVSSWFSLKKYGNEINSSSLLRIFRRMVAIFATGLFLTIFPYFARDYSMLRIMGVLQRIALAYGFGAIICLTVKKDYLWVVTAVLLLLYWALLAFLGGADPYSLNDNFALKADLAILGKNHMYKGFGIPFEPEGLLSTIPSICTVIIGYFTGELISKGSANGKTVIKLLIIGAGTAGLGYLWGMVFPINKALWTSSYVLYSAGFAMIILSLIFLIADVLKFRMWGTFFVIFGTNALFTFAMAAIWTKLMLYVIKIPTGGEKVSFYTWFYEKVCVPVAGNLNGSLMFAIIQVLLLWSIALILYRKKIMIRL